MANKVINSRIQMKRDTSANWALATTFVPLSAELIIYTDLKKIKIGDGSTTVVNLPFTDSIEGYLYNGAFYLDSEHTSLIPAASGVIYVELTTNRLYRFAGSTYVMVGGADSSDKMDRVNPQGVGNLKITGDAYANCNEDFTGGSKLATVQYVAEQMALNPVIGVATSIITAGNLSASVSFNGTYVNCYCVDSSNNIVILDQNISNNLITFTLGAAKTEDITCKVLYSGRAFENPVIQDTSMGVLSVYSARQYDNRLEVE